MRLTIIKLVFVAIAVCAALILSCCGSGGDGTAVTQSGKTGTEKPADAVVINGDTIELDYEANHMNLYYKEDIVKLNRDTVGSYRFFTYYGEDGDAYFVIRMVYFKDKSIEEVMSESDHELSDVTVNGIDYKYFEYTDNGMPGHTYVYNFEGTTYTISFASEHDISEFESAFMKTVSFR